MREHERDRRHHRQRAADLGARHVDEHQERDQHGHVGQHLHERGWRGFDRHRGRRRTADLLAGGRAEREVPRDVQHVLQAARQVVAAHLREHPHDVAEEHRGASKQQQKRDAPAAGRLGSGQEQQAEREDERAVERNVGLAERFLEELHIRLRLRRPDHEEPERRAEADREDDDVERQTDPGHTPGPGPNEEQDGREERRVERDEEPVGEAREGVALAQPLSGRDDGPAQIERQRSGDAPPARLSAPRASAGPLPPRAPPPRGKAGPSASSPR